MAKDNKNLHTATAEKNGEFYTQLSDIERELAHYRDKFNGATIFCNCDDPTESNFWRYFHTDFADLKLEKLISTHYEADSSPSYALIYDGGNDLEIEAGIKMPLKENGDFRSPECVEILKQADFVITNPPFFLFRDYIAQLIEYNKQFLVIGNQNAITYKEIFPLIRNNQMWLGYGFYKGNAYFRIPKGMDTSHYAKGVYDPETGLVKFRNCQWFTNIDLAKRHEQFFKPEEVHCYYEGNEGHYPKYNNYDVIEVGKTAEVPIDYEGVMGVPITWLSKYNPDDFEIIGMAEDNGHGYSGELSKWDGTNPHCVVNGKNKFKRLFIRNRNPVPRAIDEAL